MENKEKAEKRTRLSMSKQQKLLKEFALELGEREFGVEDIDSWFSRFEWFNKLPEETKRGRVLGFKSTMKKMYGEKFQTVQFGGGHPAKWRISETPIKPVKKYPEGLTRLYTLVYTAFNNPNYAISKKEAANILGYKTPSVSTQGLISVNNRIKRMTEVCPFEMNYSHIFTDQDIIVVNPELAKKILKKYDIEVPKKPSEYAEHVKSTIRKDYYILKMFEKGCVKFAGGDGTKFRKHVMGRTTTAAADEVAEKYQKILEKRYGAEIEIIGIPRRGFEIKKEDLEYALEKVNAIFRAHFGQDIERKEEPESIKEGQTILETLESIFEKSRGIYLEELWKKLENSGIKRGWPLLDFLRSNPDKFKVETKTRPGNSYSEDFVTYITTSEPEDVVKVVEPTPEMKETFGALVGVKSIDDKPNELLNPRERMRFAGEYYLYHITVRLDDKKAVLEYLKTYWTNESTFVVDDNTPYYWENQLKKVLTD